MKKVIALFGGILLSLIAVLNVHAITDTTILENESFQVMSLDISTEVDDDKFLPESALSETQLENERENSLIWQEVVRLHEEESKDRHTTYIKEQEQLRIAALEAIDEREEEYVESSNDTYEETGNEVATSEYVDTSNNNNAEPDYVEPQTDYNDYQEVNQPEVVEVQPEPPVEQAPPVQQTSLNWSALAQCESGGNASIVSSNGLYHGLYQFNVDTWQSVGGSGLPSQASASEQTMRAQILYNMRGSQPWPSCGGLLFS